MINNRAGSVGIRRLELLVNDRDRAILQSVSEHRYLSTRQIFELHFWSHQTERSGIRACTRVLNRLMEHRLLQRLDRTTGGTGGGSRSYVWGLDVAGDRLLRAGSAVDRGRLRPREPNPAFLAHTLAIADVRIRLEQYARMGKLELLQVTTEPANWRRFIGPGGATEHLKPDLHAVTATGEWENHYFMEIDLGTESLPVLLAKSHIYDRYRQTGREEGLSGVFPSVLWLMHTEARATRLQDAIASEPRLDHRIFTVVVFDNLVQVLLSAESTDPDPLQEPPENALPGDAPIPEFAPG